MVAWRAVAAFVVALALQVGVNYANDYSDGVRGTDSDRQGPMRLTASGTATPPAVKRAAVGAFAVGAVAGLALAAAVDWWLIGVGAAAIAAAALYTGGPRPYGYSGLGEAAVLIFFGFVATCGSTFVQLSRVPPASVVAAVAVGLPSCAVLLANNLRDIDTDRWAGKRTLAVRLGPDVAKALFVACLAGAFGAVVGLGTARSTALVGLGALPFVWTPVRRILRATAAPGLVKGLVATVRLEMVLGALLALGIWIS